MARPVITAQMFFLLVNISRTALAEWESCEPLERPRDAGKEWCVGKGFNSRFPGESGVCHLCGLSIHSVLFLGTDGKLPNLNLGRSNICFLWRSPPSYCGRA